MSKFAVGDRVKWSSDWLAQIQGHELAGDRGTVTELRDRTGKPGPKDLVRVRWEGDDEDRTTNARYLQRAR